MSAPYRRIEVTIFQKSGGPLTKRITLVNGKILSDGSDCLMANGTARRAEINGMPALADLINTFAPNEAYALGRLKDGLPDHVRVVPAAKLNGAKDPSVIARTKEYLIFKEGEPGLALLDVDLKGIPDDAKRRIEECGGVWGALCKAFPAFKTVARVERASTSSGLRNRTTGEPFPSSGGCHIVIPVLDVTDIPRFLSDLHGRLWLAGFGWGMVSAAGSFLERAMIDKFVGSPERLIFEGAPIVEPPLVQEDRNAVAHDGTILDTRRCAPLTDDEKKELQKLKDAEEHRLAPQLKAAREAWSAEHIKRLTASGKTKAAARALIDRWIDRQELTGEFPLSFDDPSIAGTTVADVLAAPDKYINKSLSDPFEGPAYGRNKAILYLRPDGSLFIHSFAHGEINYELKDELDVEIVRLARLSPLQYEKQRIAAAEKYNVRVTALDEFVAKARGDGTDKGERALYEHWAVAPWPDPVDGGVLLGALKDVARRYVFMSENEAIAVALWVAFSWLHGFLTHSPLLYVTSAEKNSGKTTLLGVLNFLVRYGMLCVHITAAALYRLITKWHPTLMADETDNLFADNPDLVAVLNSGWTRGQGVPRCNPDTGEVEVFDTFAAKAVAMKGRKLKDTTLSRAIVITMKRRRASDPREHVADFDHLDNETFALLRSQLLRWSIDNAEVIAKATPEIPPGFGNRRRANWKPLLAIAEACGWKTAAWTAALAIEAIADTFDPSIGVELLRAIKAIFEARASAPINRDRITSAQLIEVLVADKTAPWATYNKGKDISERQVAGLLKDFWPDATDRRPRTIRLDNGTTAKGYQFDWFTDAFARYCASPEEDSSSPEGGPSSPEGSFSPERNSSSPEGSPSSEGPDVTDRDGGYTPSPPQEGDLSVTSVTCLNSQDFSQFSIRHKPHDVTDEKSAKPLKNNDVTDATDKKGGGGQGRGIGPSVTDGNGGESDPSTRWPGLSPRAVDQLAREFWGLETGTAAELEDAIRSRLAKSGVPVEAHDVEVEKVVRRIEALGDATRNNDGALPARSS